MNKISKIRKNNAVLEFVYEPEATGNIGKVKYDLIKQEITEIIPSTSDMSNNYYAYKALWYMIKIIKKNEKLKKQYVQMWY